MDMKIKTDAGSGIGSHNLQIAQGKSVKCVKSLGLDTKLSLKILPNSVLGHGIFEVKSVKV